MSGLSFHWLRRGENQEERPMLSIRDLSVKVGIREILTGIRLDVYDGDQILITGPNGSGKSTLLNAIAGIMPARVREGDIFFQNSNITKLPGYERASRGISYMRQTDNVFPGLTVSENLVLAIGRDGPTLFRENFSEWAKALPMTKAVGFLSGGQKKRLAWAMTILKKSHILLLDEPKAGVNMDDDIMDIYNTKATALIIEHGGN